jgi:hypothetical protein
MSAKAITLLSYPLFLAFLEFWSRDALRNGFATAGACKATAKTTVLDFTLAEMPIMTAKTTTTTTATAAAAATVDASNHSGVDDTVASINCATLSSRRGKAFVEIGVARARQRVLQAAAVSVSSPLNVVLFYAFITHALTFRARTPKGAEGCCGN